MISLNTNLPGVLHAHAHWLVPPDAALHGAEFCRAYLQLVKRYMGQSAYEDLRDLYKEYKIKHRVISPEGREKRREIWFERNAPKSAEALAQLLDQQLKD